MTLKATEPNALQSRTKKLYLHLMVEVYRSQKTSRSTSSKFRSRQSCRNHQKLPLLLRCFSSSETSKNKTIIIYAKTTDNTICCKQQHHARKQSTVKSDVRHVRGEHQEQVWTVLQSENSVTYTGEAGALQELLQTVRLWQLRRQRAVRSLNRDNNYVSASQESSPLNRAKVKLR